ncbi:CLIP domain-containing serine protease B15-like [Drosophila eugracilis]|uniref:CLIP domain-containing serine protease B15-like n=1 Tax=Drosophila eugracilis TaxID=29029 RepID=UPI0007E6127D|nr:CLIP domain-containing serine protease B15-like [Drosophila eugracilis]
MGDPCAVLAIFAIFMLRQEAVAQFLEPNCGLTGISTKIMHGQIAEHGTNPWMAYIYKTINRKETELVCGGSLIHKEFVLTAAHCILNDDILAVRLGAYYSESRSPSSRDYAVNKAFRNKLYSRGQHINDIGILRLVPEVQFNAYIRPICIITDPTKVPNVRTFKAAGWGKTENADMSRELRTVELNELEASQCEQMFWVNLTESQICAGHSIRDTCSGDSGGPLVQTVHIDGRMRYAQFGIVSFGSSECRGHGVYTRVSSYIEWILRVVNTYSLHRRSNLQFRRQPNIYRNFRETKSEFI